MKVKKKKKYDEEKKMNLTNKTPIKAPRQCEP